MTDEDYTEEFVALRLKTLNGVFGLILNGLKTRKDTINGSHFMDAQAAMLVRIGAKAVGLLTAYRLGEACDERGIGNRPRVTHTHTHTHTPLKGESVYVCKSVNRGVWV